MYHHLMMKYVPPPHDEVLPPHDEVPPPHDEVSTPQGEVIPPHNGVPNAGSFDTDPPPYVCRCK